MTTDDALRRTVRLVVLLNIAYFGIEFAVAVAIGSVSLFADSIDFLEDSSINFLIIRGASVDGPQPRPRRYGARGHSARAWAGDPLDGLAEVQHSGASGTGCPNTHRAGALAVNLFCALTLARHRHHSGSLTRAAFLSARNDTLANVAIIAAGLVTAFLWQSAWPDLIVGLGIAAMNADAAREVWEAARDEHRAIAKILQTGAPAKPARSRW
jgi:Co/Zn/Cd efflux system component